MLSRSDMVRLRAKNLEFRLPLAFERLALPLRPALSRDPWLAAERDCFAIFTHVPKSAGTSVMQALFGRKGRHIPIIRYAAYDWRQFSASFKFTFVRNPWSRIHSAYHYLYSRVNSDSQILDHRWATCYLSETPSFEDFILRLKNRRYRLEVKRYIHFRNQLDWISIPRRGRAVDFIGRFENLENDFSEICKFIGFCEVPSLGFTRKGLGTNYRYDFTPEMVSIVGDLYEKDVLALNYEFG